MFKVTADKYMLICKYNGCSYRTLSTGKWLFLKMMALNGLKKLKKCTKYN